MRSSSILAVVLLGGVGPCPGRSETVDDMRLDDEHIEEIIVTGSRIKRDTFTSISPLQVISTEISREAGLIDPATILQESAPAAGVQYDMTWQGVFTPNGPGSSTVSLRGLGTERTLVLIDGRRMAPSGVEGAPAAPDMNMVPSLLVDRYDLLLDGASSVYGSDAVAGVINIHLRKDFDGLDVEGYLRSPQQGGGVENAIGLAWGRNYNRGLIGIGVDYNKHEAVTLADRRWSAECARDVEIDENGAIRHTNLFYQEHEGMRQSDCALGLLAGRVVLDDLRSYVGGPDPGPGSVYYTAGSTNIGIPNFSESGNGALPGGLDIDGDGIQDADFYDYSLNPLEGNQHLYPEFERLSALFYGEYRLSGEWELNPFFELHYNRRDTVARANEPLLFLPVPPQNPYNVCNPDGLAGVDCFLAVNGFWAEPHVVERVTELYGAPPQAFGLGLNPPAGAMWILPIVRVEGDRNLTEASVQQIRTVAGLHGALPFLGRGESRDWGFELAAVLSRSRGTSTRPGIRDDRLEQSLLTSMVHPATGNVVCGDDGDGDGIPDGVNADGSACVPVNLFAPSLYEPLIGDFATRAERDYLFDTRDFVTDYDQWLFTGFIHGDLFRLPAGPVAAVFGAEYRRDELESIPDDVARDGLFFSFFIDKGAGGRKYTRELFAELEMPLLADAKAAKELNLNVSGRYTEDQYFGSATTYSLKAGWRPVDSLLLRATTGTSFRAPNVRENFLESQSGISSFADPCVIPPGAYNLITGTYDPALDPREAHVLQNCANHGVDPPGLDLNGEIGYAVRYEFGGTTGLVPETSESYSYGFVWDQPFFEAFDFTFGFNVYEVDVRDSIIQPSPSEVVSDCYGAIKLDSVLCERITRDPDTRLMTLISARFVNRDQLLVSGYDINIAYHQGVTMLGTPADLAFDLVMHHPKEVSQTFTDSAGNVSYEDEAGEWGNPDWKGSASLHVDVRDWRFSWSTRYVSAVDQDPAGVDDWSDIFGDSDTCLGPTRGDVLCRDVAFADEYFLHSASVYYRRDWWSIGAGIRNVFDAPPPMVDAGEGLAQVRNMPRGMGYDLNGRTFFFNFSANFR